MFSLSQAAVDFEAASPYDLWLEELAEQHDIESPDPRQWLPWTDDDVWTISEPPEDEPLYEPDPEDREWLAPQELAEEAEAADWAEFAAWAERVEALHCGRVLRVGGPVDDLDIMLATGSCG